MQVYLDKSCYTEYTINQHIIKLYHTTQNSGSTPPISTILIDFQLIKRLTNKFTNNSKFVRIVLIYLLYRTMLY